MSEVITLNSDSESIQYLCKKDKRLAKVISMVGTITYKPYEDSYRFLVETIIGQMLSNKVADILCERLEQLCKNNVTPETIHSLSDAQIREIGISNSKVKYIRILTDAVVSGTIDFTQFPDMSDEEIIKKLTSLHGIGSWSAKMYLIFVLDRQDVLPYEDGAFLQGYSWAYKTSDLTPAELKKKCRKWKPYTSIAARYFYRALDYGLTKEEFHLYK